MAQEYLNQSNFSLHNTELQKDLQLSDSSEDDIAEQLNSDGIEQKIRRKRVFSSETTPDISGKQEILNGIDKPVKIQKYTKEEYFNQIMGRKSRILSACRHSQKLSKATTDVFDGFNEWCVYDNSNSNATRLKWLNFLDTKLISIHGIDFMKSVYYDDEKLLDGISHKRNLEDTNDLYTHQALFMSHGAVRYVMSHTKKLNVSSGVILSIDILADETWLGLPNAKLMNSHEICSNEDRNFIRTLYQDVH